MATPQVINGQAIGSIITVLDSIELASLSTQGITVGTSAYNSAVGSYFILTVSTASLVTDQVVAVSGITGLRWVASLQSGVKSITLSGAATSMSIAVTADGEYELEFIGTVTPNASTLELKDSGSSLASCRSVDFNALVLVAATNTPNTTAIVMRNDSNLTGTALNVSSRIRISRRQGVLSSFHSTFHGYDSAIPSSLIGYSNGYYTPPASALTGFSLVSSVSSGILSGTLYLRQVSA